MKFGKISNWILLGGEDLVLQTAFILRGLKEKFHIITSERNLKTYLKNGESLEVNFRKNNFEYERSNDVNTDKNINNIIDRNSIALSLSSPWIFKKPFIDKLNGRLINLHEANLPLNRGGATLSWMIMTNTNESASTLHFVNPGIDKGDIILKKSYNFSSSMDTPSDFNDFIFKNSISLIKKFIISSLDNEKFIVQPQNNEKSTYWPRLKTIEQAFINWDWNIDDIITFIKAFSNPYPGARSFTNNQMIIVFLVQVIK